MARQSSHSSHIFIMKSGVQKNQTKVYTFKIARLYIYWLEIVRNVVDSGRGNEFIMNDFSNRTKNADREKKKKNPNSIQFRFMSEHTTETIKTNFVCQNHLLRYTKFFFFAILNFGFKLCQTHHSKCTIWGCWRLLLRRLNIQWLNNEIIFYFPLNWHFRMVNNRLYRINYKNEKQKNT